VNERWDRVKQILHAASELPASEREAYVAHETAGDANLAAEVESLLESLAEAEEFLEEPPLPLCSNSDLSGRWVGEYRLDRLIAKGGMGAVYQATKQMDGAALPVAVKLIQITAASSYLTRRFRQERQILARLTHENILHLLDGGVSSDGTPYLVTEFLDARNLQDWLREAQPSLAERLRVFSGICAGVGYAHRQLVIHGDIKPSNILITRDGVPKLVDFGIARLLSGPDTGEQQATITMAPALTPWWASPEQLRGEPLSVESDTYELGRILFYLLTGHPPFDFSGLSPAQILDKLRRESTPLPSVVANDLRLSGDLDNITLKALEFDRAQRYPSADALGEDIARHLSLRPILARAQTPAYRLEKFVRRNRGLVGLSFAALLALALALGLALYQAGRARANAESSQLRFEQLRSLANTLIFEADDALATLPGATPVRARLVRNALLYLDQLASQETDDPQLKEELAAAFEKIGDIQGRPGVMNLGQIAQALDNYRKSEQILEQLRREARAAKQFVAASDNLGRTYSRISAALRAMGDVAGGLAYERKALGIRQALFEGNPNDLDLKRALASSLTTLSGSLSQMGDYAGVLDTRRQALRMAEEIVSASGAQPTDQRNLALSLARMGSIEMHEGLLRESLEHYRRALEIDSGLAQADPGNVVFQQALGWSHSNYALILGRLDRHLEALSHLQTSRQILERVVRADEHDIRGRTLLEINRSRSAQTLLRLGRPAAALAMAEASLRGREQLAARNPANAGAQGEVAESHMAIAQVRQALGQRPLAIDHYRIAHRIFSDLMAAERANAAIAEELAEVTKALQALGAPPPVESAPAASSAAPTPK
jgi:non-specific serine/threonine protein kinase/serine/threonine-protein kinase